MKKRIINCAACFVRELSRCAGIKRILMICTGKQLEEHIQDFYQVMSSEKRLKFYLLAINYDTSNMKEFAQNEGIVFYSSIDELLSFCGVYIDMIVYADGFIGSEWKLRQRTQPAKLFINHGFPIAGRNNGDATFTYSQLTSFEHFDVMLEPNKRIAEYVNKNIPELEHHVEWIGWKFSDQERQLNGDILREKMGYSPKDRIVFVVSTHGEYSLFHMLGDELLKEIEKLSDQYRFILSAHPIEYSSPNGIGNRIDALEKDGIRIRHIGEEWIPYLTVADIVITDFSTISEVAISVNKNVILSDFPDNVIWKESRLSKAREFLPIIKNASELSQMLEMVQQQENQKQKEIEELANETYISRSEYEFRLKKIVKKLLTKSISIRENEKNG